MSASATAPPQLAISGGWQLQDAAKVSDGGQAISQNGYVASGWYKATVPGTVLTSLVNDGVYPEPLYGENDRPDIIPDSLCRTSYWYRTQIRIPAEYSGRHVWLDFSGINYIADVWVNGHDVGLIRGAFSRGIFDLTPYVRMGRIATVAVLIHPPPHPGVPHEHTAKAGTGHNGGILSEDGPTFLCTLGWDWIPAIRDRDIGIWQPVSLGSSGDVVIENPTVTCELPDLHSANLTFETTLHNVTDFPRKATLVGTFDQRTFQSVVELAPGESRTIILTPAEAPQLHVDRPRLWWPNGYGTPNLYALRVQVKVAGVVSDARTLNFGIRKISYETPGSTNLTICVNGVPIMCKGGDWGMDEAMKRIGRQRLEAQIHLHKEANLNMIRNWVGQSTSDDFYDLCDKYGIMVWDEFFQPNRLDGPNVVDVKMYLDNVREKVLRYRSHPCIVIWCGRNESDPAPAAVDEGIKKIVAELDPTRLYHRNSSEGQGVRSGGPYSWRPPRMFYAFGEAFKTEIGSVSIPTLESIHAMMPAKDWQTVNDDWAEHDLCHGAQEGYRLGRLYPDIIAQRYGPIANLPDFVRKAQLANYEAFRAMYEGRLAKLFHPCTGVLTWMSNPAQPSFVWQIYSYDLEPNASFFAVKKACEPLHIQMNQDDFHVMVINNTPRRLGNLAVRIRVVDLDSSLKYDRRIPVSAAPSAATDLGEIPLPGGLSPVHFVKLELLDSSDHLISDNFYWFASPDNPDDFTSLDSLPLAALDCQMARHDRDDQCILYVSLTNSSHNVALMAHIQLRRQQTNNRVLPVYYSDNYISLLPQESRTIRVEAALSDLHGREPMITLDGWNVAVGSGPPNFVLNSDAQISSVPTGQWSVYR